MDDVKAELKQLIKDSGRKVKKIARDSGVDYFKLYRWYFGRTVVLDANDAARVKRHLEGGEA